MSKKFVALVSALSIVALAACGSDGDSSGTDAPVATASTATSDAPATDAPAAGAPATGAPDTDAPGTTAPTGTEPAEPAGGTPVSGGVVTFGTSSETLGLDPTISSAVGASGAIELIALYDVLVRVDPATGAYEYQTAESVEPNDDFSVWTLKIKPGITFSDGTDYNADAVRQSIERHRAEGTRSLARGYAATIDTMTVVDDLTLEFHLKSPWTGFPYLLSTQTGFITSPTAVAALGDQLNTNPVGAGAGPFIFVSYTPQDSIVLERNPDYWGGDVPLDGLKFVNYGGAQPTYEAFKAGEIQAAYLREPGPSFDAGEDGVPGILARTGAQDLLAINSADGHPGSDVRIRRAIAAAIDPAVISERVHNGKSLPRTYPFPENFPWDPQAPWFEPDVELATQLVEEVKAEGEWDGTIGLLASTAPIAQNWALTVEALLERAGFAVEIENVDPAVAYTRVFVDRDFDLAQSAFALPPTDGAYVQLQENLGGEHNAFGFRHEAFSDALAQLRVAATDEAKTAAFAAIAEAWAAAVPVVPVHEGSARLIFSPKLHGARDTSQIALLFDDAWLEP